MVLIAHTRLITIPLVKIADLQENDTSPHTEDISTSIPPSVKAIWIYADRVSGTGVFRFYPSSGTTAIYLGVGYSALIPIVNQELKWANAVNNDDWDIYLGGYFIDVRT